MVPVITIRKKVKEVYIIYDIYYSIILYTFFAFPYIDNHMSAIFRKLLKNMLFSL